MVLAPITPSMQVHNKKGTHSYVDRDIVLSISLGDFS